MRRNVSLAPVIAVFVGASAAYAQPVAQKVTSVEGITEYAFPNGLHLLLFPGSSKPKFTVNITCSSRGGPVQRVHQIQSAAA